MNSGPTAKQQRRSERLKHERDTFAALAFCWADIVFELDADDQVRFAAGAVEPLTGWTSEDLVGQALFRLFPESARKRLADHLADIRQGRRVADQALVLSGANDRLVPVSLAGYSLTQGAGPLYLGLRTRAAGARDSGRGQASEPPAPLFFDGIHHVMLANDVLRVEVLRAGGNTPNRAGTLAFPASQADAIVKTLMNAVREIQRRVQTKEKAS